MASTDFKVIKERYFYHNIVRELYKLSSNGTLLIPVWVTGDKFNKSFPSFVINGNDWVEFEISGDRKFTVEEVLSLFDNSEEESLGKSEMEEIIMVKLFKEFVVQNSNDDFDSGNSKDDILNAFNPDSTAGFDDDGDDEDVRGEDY